MDQQKKPLPEWPGTNLKNPRNESADELDAGHPGIKRPRGDGNPPNIFSSLSPTTTSPITFTSGGTSAAHQPCSLFAPAPSPRPLFGSPSNTVTPGSSFWTPPRFSRPSFSNQQSSNLSTAAGRTSDQSASVNASGPAASLTPNSFSFGAPFVPSAITAPIFGPAQSASTEVAAEAEEDSPAEEDAPRQEDTAPSAQQDAATIKQEAGLGNPTGGAAAQTAPDSVPGAVEVLDSRGDLTLITGQHRVSFRVCSRSLARSSSHWEKLLFGPSAESKGQQSGDNWSITLPEDDSDALRIVLQAVHCNFEAIPMVLQQETLFNITVMCDKYDMVKLLKPFWNDWVTNLAHARRDPSGFVHRLWIAQTLGYLEYYKTTLTELMATLRLAGDGSGIYLESYLDENLNDNTHFQRLKLLEDLEQGRLALLREIGGRLKQAMAKLTDQNTQNCRSQGNSDWQKICDCAMLGALHRTLHGKTWYYSGVDGWEDRLRISVRHLVMNIDGVRAATIAESRMASRKGGQHHQLCTPWIGFELPDILKTCRVEDVLVIDEEYFTEQQAKSGVKLPTGSSGNLALANAAGPRFFNVATRYLV